MGDSAHTTHHTNPGKKSAPPLFLEEDNIFQKSASVVVGGIAVELRARRPIFEKSYHLLEKGGVLRFFFLMSFSKTLVFRDA
jgi:hypothetical protein